MASHSFSISRGLGVFVSLTMSFSVDRVLVIDVSDETIRTKSNWRAKTVIFCFNGNSWFILALQWSAV